MRLAAILLLASALNASSTAFCADEGGVIAALSLRKTNAREFARLLRERKVDSAQRFYPLFADASATEAELLAQFQILSCRPRAAWSAIERISDPERKSFFQAALLAMVSVSRPEAPPSTLPEPRKHDTAATRSMPLHPTEIWADEWKGIRLNTSPCQRMPIVSSLEEADRNRRTAAALFSKLPERYFLGDFNVVALALDVGAVLPSPRRIASAYAATRATDPYYIRLVAEVADASGGHDELHVTHAAPKRDRDLSPGSRLELSPIALRSSSFSTHEAEIPILLDPEAFR